MPTENRSSNTEMVSELLPCPFCGEKPQITKHHREDIYSFMHRCAVLGPISWGFREDQQAHAEKWNARAQPAEQHEAEPVALPARKSQPTELSDVFVDANNEGWNACLDEIAKLGPLYSQPVQGEPVAWLDPNAGLSWLVDRMTVAPGTKLYPHAAPAEVERLRAELENSYTVAEHERLVAKGQEINVSCIRSLRVQLAEAHGLLRLIAEQPMLNGVHRARIKTLLSASPGPSAPVPFQARVQPWLMQCFGEMIAGDREERNHRFLEESLELIQAMGATADEAHQLVDYVFGREVGEPAQEVGGVMVTLAALCLANGLDMHELAETELARIWTKVDAIRAKQASKPQFGPLPGVYPDRKK